MSVQIRNPELIRLLAADFVTRRELVATAGNRLTLTSTDLTVSGGGALNLSSAGTYTLTVPKTGTVPVGTGTAGRIAEWVTDANTVQASTLIKSGAGVLTLSAAADYTLTIPATGTAALATGVAGGQTIYGGTGASETLTLQSTSHATKSDILLAPSTDTGTHRVGIGSGGNLFGKFYIHANTPGSTLTFVVENGDNTNAASHARLRFITQPGGGDPFIRFDANTAFAVGIDQSDSGKFKISRSGQPGTNDVIIIDTSSNVGINKTAPAAQMDIDQSSTTTAKPTLRLRQADLSEEFIRFDSTVGAGNPINTTALGAYYGRVRVYVEGVGAKWLALYD